MTTLITISLIVIAAIANAIMDKSSENDFEKDFWNKYDSWRNKWDYSEGYLLDNYKKSWKYLWIFTPKYKERFYLSSTILVFLTDGWHLAQFVFHSSWQLAISINMDNTFLSFCLLKLFFSFIFELSYNSINKNK